MPLHTVEMTLILECLWLKSHGNLLVCLFVCLLFVCCLFLCFCLSVLVLLWTEPINR